MAKDECMRAVIALGGSATKPEVGRWLAGRRIYYDPPTLWNNLWRLANDGVLRYNYRNHKFKMTGKIPQSNIVILNADLTTEPVNKNNVEVE